MPKPIKMVGRQFANWEVLEEAEKRNNKRAFLCRCKCGSESVVMGDNLRSGGSTRCKFCSAKVKGGLYGTHGRTGTRIYAIWRTIKLRCRTPSFTGFKNYGGRGIDVCDAWFSSFETFLEDMGEPPTDKHQIDRIDNDGNYEPGNCRWVTCKENHQNRRNNVILEFEGRKMTIAAWAEEFQVNASTLYMRHYAGWSAEKVVGVPVDKDKSDPVLEIDGVRSRLSHWAKLANTHPHTIKRRLRNGWSNLKAVTGPARSEN